MKESATKSKETAIEMAIVNGATELIIREGDALEMFNPEAVKINGVLDSPFKWLDKRIGGIDQLSAHILVDRNLMSVSLVERELDHFKNNIVGKLELHPIFLKFNINAGVYLTPEKMAEFFKMHRSFFENQSSAMGLVSELKNFKAKVNKEIESANDNRGNTKNSKVQAVESNIPDKFNLVLPIFKGQPKYTIEVEVYINPDDLTCTLISPAANDKIEEIRDASIDDVLKNIITIAPNIVIIEQ